MKDKQDIPVLLLIGSGMGVGFMSAAIVYAGKMIYRKLTN